MCIHHTHNTLRQKGKQFKMVRPVLRSHSSERCWQRMFFTQACVKSSELLRARLGGTWRCFHSHLSNAFYDQFTLVQREYIHFMAKIHTTACLTDVQVHFSRAAVLPPLDEFLVQTHPNQTVKLPPQQAVWFYGVLLMTQLLDSGGLKQTYLKVAGYWPSRTAVCCWKHKSRPDLYTHFGKDV